VTLHWQPLPLICATAVGTAAGIFAARAADSPASRSDGVVGEHTRVGPVPGLTVTAGAAAGAAMGVRFGLGTELAAYLLLVAVALPLSAIDIAVRKVPDRFLLPAVPAAVALLALSAHSAGTYAALGRAVLAGVVSFTAYLALALMTGQLGLGDCKAAGLCGIFLGYLGWNAAALGALAAFLLAGIVAVGRMIGGNAARDKTLAFAPFIFAGALVVTVIS
jgi:leader peptidase (prepilin peptidase)/N-methyltransferase